jgi:recombinational DNA repair protein RecR
MSRTQIFDDIEINNEEDIPRESLFKFVARINNTEAALKFCVSCRLIPNSRRCPKCSKAMNLRVRNRNVDGFEVS